MGANAEGSYNITSASTSYVDMSYYEDFSHIADLLGVPVSWIEHPFDRAVITYNGQRYYRYWLSGHGRTSASYPTFYTTVGARGHKSNPNALIKVTRMWYASGTYGRIPNSSYATGGSCSVTITLSQNLYSVLINTPMAASDTFTYSVGAHPNANGYGFTFNNNSGYYISENRGVDSSAAMCRVSFTSTTQVNLKVRYIKYTEYLDYGAFGEIDRTITSARTNNSNVFLNLTTKDDAVSYEKNFTYENIQPGAHYFDVRYTKDNRYSYYNDRLYFNFSPIMTSNPDGKAFYRVTFGPPINVSGTTTAQGKVSVYSSANTSVCAALIQREGSEDIMGNVYSHEELIIIPSSNYQLVTTKVLNKWTDGYIVHNKYTIYASTSGTSDYIMGPSHFALNKPASSPTLSDGIYTSEDEEYAWFYYYFPNLGSIDVTGNVTVNVDVAGCREAEEGTHEFEAADVSFLPNNAVHLEQHNEFHGTGTVEHITYTKVMTKAQFSNFRIRFGVGYYGVRLAGVTLIAEGDGGEIFYSSEDDDLMWTDDKLPNYPQLVTTEEFLPTKKGTRLHDIKTVSGVTECASDGMSG